MLGLADDQRRRRISPELIFRCMISCIFAIVTQFSLLLIPHFFRNFSLLSLLLLSAAVLVIVIGFAQYIRKLLRIRASAPAFVFFHIIFIWLVYIVVIRQAVSPLVDIVLNLELAVLLIGFFRILASDPGFVHHDSPDLVDGSVLEDGAHLEDLPSSAMDNRLQSSTESTSLSSRRVRYCRSCEAYVRGYDHHCPAFGNCIGQRNHVLFMVLLVGFIMTEASYAMGSYQWIESYEIINGGTTKDILSESLVVSTMLFSFLQLLWQVLFLAWHIYCVCLNIRTDEWINWRKYPELHIIIQPTPGQSFPEMRFRNPYDKGILSNLKDFLLRRD